MDYNSSEEILDDQLLVSFDNVLECLSQSRGSLFLTAVQLVFYNSQDTINESPSVQLKYFAISNYSVVDGNGNLKKLCIFAKNFQSFEFELPNAQIEKICSTIFEKTKNLFTQNYAIKNSLYFSDFSYYNWKIEFERQKVSKEWKITEINNSYSVCPSYMNSFIVPANITDEEIKEVSLYRSKGRIPVLTYYHSKNGASISRSSQPMVGLFRTRNKFDEKYLDQIRLTQRDPKKQKLFIVDCRSALNAYANSAKGAGTELIQNYPDCSLEYCGIENIHAMRNSLYEIFNYISPANSSAWTSQLLSIIQSSKRVAEIIDSGYPVLIHCSDGWDRTSQISSLSQLLIDPFYRTIEGFQQLIEKDWVRFGHKFLDRCAHGKQNYWEEHEQSPIFLQFLDCVYQLSRQYHTIFEFNSNLLVFILDSVYSCDFGEFLFNNEKQRKQFKAKIASIWKYFEKNRSQYVNKFYEKYEGIVLPNCSIKLLQLWEVYVKRSGGKRIENQEYYFNQKLNEEELKQLELQKQLEDLNSKYEKLLQEIALNKQNLTNEAILKTSPEDEKGKYYALLQSGYFSGKDFNIPSVKKFSPAIIDDYDPVGNSAVIDLRGNNNNSKQVKNEKNENDLITGSANIINLENHDENFDIGLSQSAQSWAEYLIGSACKLTTSIWSTKELIENNNDNPTPAV